ncbi:four helix bundle protein [Flavobacterium sp.]|jgi:four helix bundle protein|uniref:four helix bundle protein n=1 Tax=Flavobacterium sp. TaxID=239 RepID=UPI0038D10FED
MSSYQDLDIYKNSLDLFYEVHAASLLLPKYELYELGSQIRRSSDSVNSNIVEGYGRNRYKAEFIRFLVFSHSSCLETKGHLIKINHLYEGLIPNIEKYISDYDNLGAKIFNFIKYVESNWKT